MTTRDESATDPLNGWTGWDLDPDPLVAPADDPPPPRRSGCLSVLSLALLLAIALGIAPSPPRTAPEPVSGVGSNDVAAALPVAGGEVRAGGSERETIHLAAAMTRTTRPAPLTSSTSAVRTRPRGIVAAPSGSVGTALLGGWISWADPDLGGDYLATRFPRGTLVRLCTPNRCIVRRSNDFGPSAKIDPPRIADLAVLDWESLCGLPRARGVCRGTVEAIGEIALPPTDTAP